MRCQSHMSSHCLGYIVANYYPFMPRARYEILVIPSKDSLMCSFGWAACRLLEQTLSFHELLPSTFLPNLCLVRLDQVTPSGCLLDLPPATFIGSQICLCPLSLGTAFHSIQRLIKVSYSALEGKWSTHLYLTDKSLCWSSSFWIASHSLYPSLSDTLNPCPLTRPQTFPDPSTPNPCLEVE